MDVAGAAASGAFVLLLANIFLLGPRLMADLSVAGLAAAALLLLARDWRADQALRRLVAAFAAGFGFLGLATFASEAVDGGDLALALRNGAMVAALLLVGREFLHLWGGGRSLMVLLVAGAACAVTSLLWYAVAAPELPERLVPFGRPANPIPASGALAAAAVAGLALLRAGTRGRDWPVALAVVAIVLAMLLAQSRGPLIGFGAAALLVLAGGRRRLPLLAFLLFTACASLVLLEPAIRAALCEGEAALCRPSLRQPIWREAWEVASAHPLWGVGVRHQRPDGSWMGHSHNAALTLLAAHGVPFTLVLVAAAWWGLRRLATLPETPAVAWAAAMALFSAAFLAFEFSPFAYHNAHYLFLWLPVAVALRPRAG